LILEKMQCVTFGHAKNPKAHVWVAAEVGDAPSLLAALAVGDSTEESDSVSKVQQTFF
jgi:hypothetical protein